MERSILALSIEVYPEGVLVYLLVKQLDVE